MAGPTQAPLPFADDEGEAGQPGRVTGVVRRSIQLGDNVWCTFVAGLDLPPGATPEEIQRAQVTQQAVLQVCWDTATGLMVDLLLNEAHRVTIPQLVAIVHAMDRLEMTVDGLREEALALGLPWPDQGLAELPFAAAAALQDTLYRRLEAAAQPAARPAARPAATIAAAPPPPEAGVPTLPAAAPAATPPAAAPITKDNVGTVPIEQLGEVLVHWGKGPELGGWKGKKVRDIPVENLAFFANVHGDGWQPRPWRGKIDPRDEILQTAARRYYEHLVAQRQEE